MYQRAAQFAPFAAITGHSAVISQTARLTDKVIELSESECEVLNQKITLLLAHLDGKFSHILPVKNKDW